MAPKSWELLARVICTQYFFGLACAQENLKLFKKRVCEHRLVFSIHGEIGMKNNERFWAVLSSLEIEKTEGKREYEFGRKRYATQSAERKNLWQNNSRVSVAKRLSTG